MKAIPEPNSQFWTEPKVASATPSTEPEPSIEGISQGDNDSDDDLWAATSVGIMDDDELSSFLESIGIEWWAVSFILFMLHSYPLTYLECQ